MVQQNLVRPRTETENKKPKSSILVLSLIGTCIFLLVLCVCLVTAIVLVGRNLSNNSESMITKLSKNNQLSENFNDQLINNFVSNTSNNIRLKSVNNLLLENRNNNLSKSEVKFRILNLPTGDSELNKMTTQRVSGIISKVLDKLTYRLPDEIRPKLYNLNLTPDLLNEKFIGNVTIHLEVTKPINFIAVHTKKLNITDTKLVRKQEDGLTFNNIDIKQTYEYEPYEYWVTEFENFIDVGNYMLNLNFNGSLANRIVGLYQSTYFDNTKNQTRKIATSKFEPTYARQAFPCFDEPAMKAEFEISLVRPTADNYTALSNMEVKEEVLNEDGLTTTVHFHKSVPMSTYLACFIVSDFVYKNDTVNVSIPNLENTFELRVFATPEQINKTDFALETGKKVTEFYIKYFNIKYPLNKLDMVAIPDFVSGAMEHWGLVTFRETALLYDNNTSSTINKQRVATVIAHELAHQWFGNLVTMAWWNELWLNEGFASYIEYKGTDAVYPDWGMMDQFLLELHSVLNFDAKLSSHPIVQTVTNPDQITELFDSITYKKGAAVIRMLEDFVGAENFRTAVTHYLQKFAYKNAETYDLLNEIDNLGDGLDVKNIMDTWTRQMGLPYIIVENISTTEYKITQKRFLLNPDIEGLEQTPSDYNYRWFIPLTYYTDTKSDTGRQWFPNTDSSVIIKVEDSHKWIKFNRNQTGYYRVLYPEKMWITFRESLITNINALSISDRANLLNDAFNFADATLLPYHIAMDLTNFLANENEYVVWAVASSKLLTILDLFHGSSDIYSMFKEYGRRIIKKSYDDIKRDDSNGHLQNRLKSVVLNFACKMGVVECNENVKKQFNEWIMSPEIRPKPDMRSLIYHHGMALDGNAEKWEKMWNLYLQETDAQEKLKLMSGLAAVEDISLLTRFLDLAKDSTKIRSQDYFTCLQYIASNKYGESLVWDFIRNNWTYLVDRFTTNDRYLGNLVGSVTSSFNTEVKLDDMKNFFRKYPNAGAGTVQRAQALERVANNIKWLENNKESIRTWLDHPQI